MKTEHLSLLSLDLKREENNLGWMDSLFNWSKYISIGLGAIFAAFVIVKAWIAYQNYRNKKWQKQQTEKLKKQEEVEESLKFELFKHILCSENNKEVEQRLYYDNEECESDFNFEDSTNHSSSKCDDEECKICINSYLSENNDCDDVIRKKNYIHIHQKKIKDFINLFVQNPCNQLEKEKYVEKMGIRKSCRNFQKLYNVVSKQFLSNSKQTPFQRNPQPIPRFRKTNIVDENVQKISGNRDLNFFDILSKMSNEYVKQL